MRRNQEQDYDALCLQALEAFERLGTKVAAALELGVPVSTLKNRLTAAYARDLAGRMAKGVVGPGMEVRAVTSRTDREGNIVGQTIWAGAQASDDSFDIPEGHEVKGVSAFVGPDGRVFRRWVKTRATGLSESNFRESIRLTAETHTPAAPLEPEMFARTHDPALLNLHPLPDLHLGVRPDISSGQKSWSLEGAVETYKGVMRKLIVRAPSAREGVILGLGDALHFDDDTMMTRRSGHVLPGTANYAECLSAAQGLFVYQTEIALMAYEKVSVRIIRGNHDPDSALAVAHFLKAWFRDSKRVEVDTDSGATWVRQHGKVMLAGTHGHETKIHEMPGIMASDHRRIWGETEWRYAHGGHLHHAAKSNGEADGVEWETHQAPIPRDAYHQSRRYRSQRSLCVISYHADRGYCGRVVETI